MVFEQRRFSYGFAYPGRKVSNNYSDSNSNISSTDARFGIPYDRETDKQETITEILEEGVVSYMKFPAKFFDEMASEGTQEEMAEIARSLGVWNRCLFIELSG